MFWVLFKSCISYICKWNKADLLLEALQWHKAISLYFFGGQQFGVWWIYQKFYIGMVFGGTVFRATVFGLLAALKIAPLKPHPKNRTPKKPRLYAVFKFEFNQLLFLLKNSRPCRDLNPGFPQYQADMLPTELSWLGWFLKSLIDSTPPLFVLAKSKFGFFINIIVNNRPFVYVLHPIL